MRVTFINGGRRYFHNGGKISTTDPSDGWEDWALYKLTFYGTNEENRPPTTDDQDTWDNWATYVLLVIEEELGQGWYGPCYRGPGRRFCERPRWRYHDGKFLVRRVGGLDI